MSLSLGKNKFVFLAATLLPVALLAGPDTTADVKFLQTIVMPDVPKGPYTDHLAVDLSTHRLFTTPQAQMSVQVLDYETGKLIHTISGVKNPHSILYRSDLNRIYITDGGDNLLRIYDGKSYQQIGSIDKLPEADSAGYDAATKILYVTTAGEDAAQHPAHLNAIDTTNSKLLGDVLLPAKSPEAMAMEAKGSRIFVDLMDRNQVAVVDRDKRQLVATWPVTKCTKPIAIGIDEAHSRIFVGCRDTETSGTLDVIDTNSGKELATYPLGGWVDYIVYDAGTKRIYASCGAPVPDGGALYAYQENEKGEYKLVSKVPTAPRAKTALYVPELKRIFVSVPHFEGEARVLVYQVP